MNAGGHAVPEEKVRSRLPRTLDNVSQAIPLADEVHLLDNASWEDPFRRVAVIREGEAEMLTNSPPSWVAALLEREPVE